ncbi:hypothetical protein C4M96_00425 [Mycoplasmopsis pullorum]|uniref:aromatic motif membrane protein n=1 Tax=Mycoplasmopsis pullorum TaxID=48003 RepID=UPI0011183012|nr:aromatic motif membrane protein [Mycoplasmopsis pullorum]TNK82772.1 hypothetical protein C4M93_03565 [Mycoplasmopsis pullorum]TNK92501.1 hypothetical protein C4M96_00425 [Mycoplasmopsis pullorum]
MKKLLKISFLSLIFAAPLFLSAACTNTNVTQIQYQKEFSQSVDAKLNDLVKSFFDNDQKQIQDFYTKQQQIQSDLIKEFNYAILFAPLWDVNVYSNSGDKVKRTNLAIKKIKNILNDDWFWFLNNIKKQVFVFNPYGNYYDGSVYSSDENLKEKIQNMYQDQTILETVKSNHIENIHEIKIANSKYDQLQNKKLFFIELEENKLVPILSFESKNKRYLKILPELLVVEKNDNLTDLLSDLTNSLFEAKNLYDEEEREYQISLDPNFDFENYLKNNNDEKVFDFYRLGNYSEFLKRAINKINAQGQTKIKRYTWGYVNEDK